ncbi:hypothetical protein J2S19_001638 [Metabacillus malikii]|uniref:Uncharacterized protein n=1 Tax=Metabacillus malikii TaxID=1504265 RepID=A0ABT9ZDR9_9BACI|nr:hypothetical protein [Metabacillus malikii]
MRYIVYDELAAVFFMFTNQVLSRYFLQSREVYSSRPTSIVAFFIKGSFTLIESSLFKN